MVLTQSIPVLDLRDFHASGDRRTNFIIQLGQALEKTGFFAITHHGVDSALIQQAYQVAEQFFELPEAIKQQYEVPELHGQRGFTSFGQEHAKDHPYPDLKEFWHVGRDLLAGHPLTEHYAANLQVAEVPQFHPVMTQLYAQLEVCAAELLKACALYLGEPETLLSDMIQESDTILRIIHYPPIPPDAHPASLRSAPHEDINVHPRQEIDLTPLPGCIAKVGRQQFPAITAGEYLMQRLREIGLAE
ncbi:MAG: isopenicillin N synthase family dioxygenase [Leptodesmis sp.]|uniref:isopenicillin N synthase family dioxygenase n=1 Tax=Leptodesmis sp. TaxID=3100501 RepID=UPI003D14B2E8